MASRIPFKNPVIAKSTDIPISAPKARTEPILKPGVDTDSEDDNSKVTRASMISPPRE